MWSEDEVCPSTMMPVQDSYTDCSAGEHGGTCVYDPDTCMFGSDPTIRLDDLDGNEYASTGPFHSHMGRIVEATTTGDVGDYLFPERRSYPSSACSSPSVSSLMSYGSPEHTGGDTVSLGFLYDGRNAEDWKYDVQQASSRPLSGPMPEQDFVPAGPWDQSQCRFGIECGVPISNASVAGVYNHLSQYHLDDPYCRLHVAPIHCSWDHCSESREDAVALCEHIIAQHINPCLPEGCMDLSLADEYPWPTACYGILGSSLQQQELFDHAALLSDTYAKPFAAIEE